MGMAKVRYRKNGLLIVFVAALLHILCYRTAFLVRLRRFENGKIPNVKALDSLGQPKCFKESFVNRSAACAACVNFITIANIGGRWRSINVLLAALRILDVNLRLSQPCFKLYVYTNIPPNSRWGMKLRQSGGPSVLIHPFPTDLPRNQYSGKDDWMELSRKKLDLVVRHTATYGHKVIWTDLDSVVLTDLSCAYTQLPHFVVSRRALSPHVVFGPLREKVHIRAGHSVYGDLWMANSDLVNHVRWLEAAGMPPPKYDLQDYFSYLLNLCNGTMIDLRGFLRDESGNSMCMGFDFANGWQPMPDSINPMRVVDGYLQCGVRRGTGLAFARMATISMTFPVVQHYVFNSHTAIFKTTELSSWARVHGFLIS